MRRKSKSEYEVVPFFKLPNTKAWKLTSELVRKLAKGVCFTCKRRVGYAKLAAGHSREKRGNAAIYFELDGLRGQCNYCNRRLHGNYGVFILNLVDEIGRERVDALARKAQKGKQWTKAELSVIAEARKDDLTFLKIKD